MRDDITATIPEGPTEWSELGEDLKARFTMDGRIPVFSWFLRENIPDKVGTLWSQHMILNGIFQACRRGDLGNIRSYDARSIFDLYKLLEKYPVAYKDVLVIGSIRPWIEVCCLAFGARTVTTVDFNPPVSEYNEIRTVSVEQFEKENQRYDVLMSFSSLEHDGLGRYGDPIDPDGDLKHMRSYLDFIKPDGVFCLGVPCGNDALFWNAHRIYGALRFPMLIEHWKMVDYFLDGVPQYQVFNEKMAETWWVLKPTTPI